MNRTLSFIAGPELLLLVFYFIIVILIKATNSPIKSMDSFWANTAFIIPLIIAISIFSLYYFPGIQHKWLLPRTWLSALIGGHYVLSKSLNAHSVGGPGIGTAYIMGMGFIIVLLVAGTIVVLIKVRA